MDMSLASGAMSGLNSMVGAYFGNKASKYTADASNKIRAINNQTAMVVSQRNAVLSGMQRWAQGVRNDRVYEGVAANQEALAVNFNRARDARTRQNFSVNIQQAEESGRQAAAAAASGVSGSIVDVIDMTTRLRNGIQNIARIEAEDQMVVDYGKQEFAQRWALLDSLDYSLIFDNMEQLDFGHTEAKSVNPLSAGVAGILGTKGAYGAIATGISNFFNTPSTGNSSLDGFLTLNDNFSTTKV